MINGKKYIKNFFKNKYIKYKNKYNYLKLLGGGKNNITVDNIVGFLDENKFPSKDIEREKFKRKLGLNFHPDKYVIDPLVTAIFCSLDNINNNYNLGNNPIVDKTPNNIMTKLINDLKKDINLFADKETEDNKKRWKEFIKQLNEKLNERLKQESASGSASRREPASGSRPASAPGPTQGPASGSRPAPTSKSRGTTQGAASGSRPEPTSSTLKPFTGVCFRMYSILIGFIL